ncbi:hypothetical protein HYX10_02115 [Candidatus Woesearchaeota archaeon]|nr:hypothetical protein [Candidatus Woesearchaeota archaeon]
MNLQTINPHVLKIMISARKKDSISSISKRISLSYGWTYKWVHELSKSGVFRLTRMHAFLNERNAFYANTLEYIRESFRNDVSFHYSALPLFGIAYCFTATDAVYVWTKGGYNIGRNKKFYPIFIKVKSSDRILFEEYCRKLGLKINGKSGVFYKAAYLPEFAFERCEGIPVESLQSTVDFMKKYIYNFEPALEMVKERYGLPIKAKYSDDVSNV